MINTDLNTVTHNENIPSLNWLEQNFFNYLVLTNEYQITRKDGMTHLTVASKELLPAEFVNLIGNSSFLLTHLDFSHMMQIIADNMDSTLGAVIEEINRLDNSWLYCKELMTELPLRLIRKNSDCFFSALLLNNKINFLLDEPLFLTNMLYLYKFCNEDDNKPTKLMSKLLPLIVQKSYQHYNELDIHAVNLLDSLTSKSNICQPVSLFATAILAKSDFISLLISKNDLSKIKVKLVGLHSVSYLSRLTRCWEEINKTSNLEFKCYSKQDLNRTINLLAFSMQYLRQDPFYTPREIPDRLEELVPSIHLNGFHRFVVQYAKESNDQNVKTICQMLAKVKD